ncbi:MAG: hypothetical protein ACYCW6_02495 [Candidatus Xenobia bacterium]
MLLLVLTENGYVRCWDQADPPQSGSFIMGEWELDRVVRVLRRYDLRPTAPPAQSAWPKRG